MTHSSRVSRVAARMGSEAFFDPLTFRLPLSWAPPWTTNFSMQVIG